MHHPPTIGDLAPELELPDLTGTPVGVGAFRGRRVIFFFWASW